jgi:hypothetical protein
MKPNPQQKCIVIKTIGRRTLSLQDFPMKIDESVIADIYIKDGARKIGLKRIARVIDSKLTVRLIGGAR